jgi:hypothetical protein
MRRLVLPVIAVSGWAALAVMFIQRSRNSDPVVATGPAASPPARPTPAGDHGSNGHHAPPPVVTAESERDAYLTALRTSGSSEQKLAMAAEKVFESWRRVARQEKGRAKLDAAHCYAGGCVVTVHYTDKPSFDRIAERMAQTREFLKFPGGKWRSGPINRSKAVEASWILFPEPETASGRGQG